MAEDLDRQFTKEEIKTNTRHVCDGGEGDSIWHLKKFKQKLDIIFTNKIRNILLIEISSVDKNLEKEYSYAIGF